MDNYLYVIGTPIGNMQDIGLRALETLRTVDVIVCEDTRVTKRLLNNFEIVKPLISFHAQSKESSFQNIISLLKDGKNLALVTDAGTPAISDPGSLLISRIYNELKDIRIRAIPGPSALTSALSISGLPTDEFTFYGFLPHKKGREKILNEILKTDRTCVFYESTHRIMRAIEQMSKIFVENKTICIVREISKIYEEVIRGDINQIKDFLLANTEKQKGEFVVIVSRRV